MVNKKPMSIEDLAVITNNLVVTTNGLVATTEDLSASIDNFAIMTQQGFTDITKTIHDLPERMRALEEYVNKFERSVEGRFDAIFYEFKDIKNKLQEVDSRADVMDLQVRVSALEKKLKK